MFKPMNTATAKETHRHKALVYAFHGWGKTTQAAHMQRSYGKTFIISGESGLKSVSDENIDFLPFTSWDGEHNPEKGVFSFRGIVNMMRSPEFKEAGYECIFIDSLTELADRCLEHWQKVHEDNKNAFALWGDYGSSMLGALKWVRDLPYHVVVTALAKEGKDDNGDQDYWPHIQGNAVQKQVGGIFDHVFCGVRVTDGDRHQRVRSRCRRVGARGCRQSCAGTRHAVDSAADCSGPRRRHGVVSHDAAVRHRATVREEEAAIDLSRSEPLASLGRPRGSPRAVALDDRRSCHRLIPVTRR